MISSEDDNKPFVVFFFSGQGGIFPELAKELYDKQPIFKQEMDIIDEIFKSKYYGYSMIERLRSIKNDDREGLYEQHLAHSVLFMLQVSLFRLYKHYGVIPDLIFGISLGEIASAYCSGMLDIETACFLSYSRADLLIKTIPEQKYDSTLISVDISEVDYLNKYSTQFPSIEIACFIHSNTITLGGKNEVFKELLKQFDNDKVAYKLLPIASSFHTSSVDCIKDLALQLSFKNKEPIIKHLSSVDCKLFNLKDHPFDSNYLFNNIRKPCLLNKSVEVIYQEHYENNNQQSIIIVEISAQFSLSYFMEKTLNEISNNNNNKVLSTLYKDNRGDLNTFSYVISLINKNK